MDKYKKYIENTTWIVPYETLLAYTYTENSQTPVQDQTVWKIHTYDNGYFLEIHMPV